MAVISFCWMNNELNWVQCYVAANMWFLLNFCRSFSLLFIFSMAWIFAHYVRSAENFLSFIWTFLSSSTSVSKWGKETFLSSRGYELGFNFFPQFLGNSIQIKMVTLICYMVYLKFADNGSINFFFNFSHVAVMAVDHHAHI